MRWIGPLEWRNPEIEGHEMSSHEAIRIVERSRKAITTVKLRRFCHCTFTMAGEWRRLSRWLWWDLLTAILAPIGQVVSGSWVCQISTLLIGHLWKFQVNLQIIAKACSSHFWHLLMSCRLGYHTARVANVQKGIRLWWLSDGAVIR